MDDYIKGVEGYITTIPTNIFHFCKELIETTNYNGFIQFEFIKDDNDIIYIMECNPRMSSSVSIPLYFKLLVESHYYVKSTYIDKTFQLNEYDKPINVFNLIDFNKKYLQYKLDTYIKNKINTIIHSFL